MSAGARVGLAAAVLAAAPARAERPVLAGEATFGEPRGEVLVHYATQGTDAVPVADADGDGVPDFVAEVAATAEVAIDHYRVLGFRRPRSDDPLGGDGRIDLYLRDLVAADGNAGTDACTANTCTGFAIAENDYAGFGYPSVSEGIQSVVPHELFHLVQYAYAMDQPATWTEGTAVWAVEHLFGEHNADFERFLPAFLERTYRPFERPVGGFGDAYPYGAALWPYFLEHRFGATAIVGAWTASGDARFLEATAAVLAQRGTSLDDAWTEFTRWNAFTGAHAGPAAAYPGADAWSAAPREPAIDATIHGEGATIHVEGLSARYVPVVLAERSRLEVAPAGGIRIAAWLVPAGEGPAGGAELVASGGVLAATADPGAYTLVVTGLSRGTITTAVELAITAPEPTDPGGCASTRSPGALVVLVLLVFAAGRRPGSRSGNKGA